MVYRKGGSKVYWTRVRDCDGRTRLCSTETILRTTAASVESWHTEIRRRLDPGSVLTAIIDKEITLAGAYRLGEAGTVAHLQAVRAAAADVDLRTHFEAFKTWRGARSKGVGMVPKYAAQIEALWPEPTWRRSMWTPKEHARRLDALVGVIDATRNRYRAALSAFSKYLVRVGVLEYNPLRSVEGFAESPTQEVWYPVVDVQRVMRALPDEFRVRELLMVGAGMDWTDCQRLRRRDIDFDTKEVRCHGSKTSHRNRVVRLTEAWVIPLLKPLVATLLPDALVCLPHAPKVALQAHRAALTACKLTDSTLHNWRHHYAVTCLKRKDPPRQIAHQLGKANVKDVLDRYGKYVPQAEDYEAFSGVLRQKHLAATPSRGVWRRVTVNGRVLPFPSPIPATTESSWLRALLAPLPALVAPLWRVLGRAA